jgi:hypothetical protein
METEVDWCVQKGPQLIATLNTALTLLPFLLNINSNIILVSTPRLPSNVFFTLLNLD